MCILQYKARLRVRMQVADDHNGVLTSQIAGSGDHCVVAQQQMTVCEL